MMQRLQRFRGGVANGQSAPLLDAQAPRPPAEPPPPESPPPQPPQPPPPPGGTGFLGAGVGWGDASASAAASSGQVEAFGQQAAPLGPAQQQPTPPPPTPPPRPPPPLVAPKLPPPPPAIVAKTLGPVPTQKLEDHHVQAWLDYQFNCRSIPKGPSPSDSGGKPRMYVIRVSAVEDLEVPIVFKKPEAIGDLANLKQQVQHECTEALFVYLRMSFLHEPPGGPAEVYGHSFIGHKLEFNITDKDTFKLSLNDRTLKGTLALKNTKRSQLFAFHTCALGQDWQILLDVLVEEDPQRIVDTERIWRLDPTATLGGGPKRVLPRIRELKRLAMGAPEGGRARRVITRDQLQPPSSVSSKSSSLAILSKKAGNSKLVVDLPEPLRLGWAQLRFDGATERPLMTLDATQTAQQPPRTLSVKLFPGSLRDRLLAPLKEGVPPHYVDEAYRLSDLIAFMKPITLKDKVASLQYDVVMTPLSDATEKLLPADMPVPLGAERLGGITSKCSSSGQMAFSARVLSAGFDHSQIQADFQGCLLQKVSIAFPQGLGWMETARCQFLKSLVPPLGKRPHVKKGDPQPTWRLKKLSIWAGAHNTIRWLDASLDGSKWPWPMNEEKEEDQGKGTWRLVLTRAPTDRNVWESQQVVPLELIMDEDCAVVFQLVAEVVFGNPLAQPADSLSSPEPPPTEKYRIGWSVMLPRWHTTRESLAQAQDQRSDLIYKRFMNCGHASVFPEVEEPFAWQPKAPAPGARPFLPVELAFHLHCPSLASWLEERQQKLEHEARVARSILFPSVHVARVDVAVLAVRGLKKTNNKKNVHVQGTVGNLVQKTGPAKYFKDQNFPAWEESNTLIFDAMHLVDKSGIFVMAEHALQLDAFEEKGTQFGKVRRSLQGLPLNTWNDCKDSLDGHGGEVEYRVYLHGGQPKILPEAPPTQQGQGQCAPNPPPLLLPPHVDRQNLPHAPPGPQLPTGLPAPPPTKAFVGPAPPPTVHQPAPIQAAPMPPGPQPVPPVQVEVEKVFLRDMATQSDPPPLDWEDDHIIGEGAAPSTWLLSRREQAYTGPGRQPLGSGDRERLLQELGNTSAGRLLRGASEAGPPRRELRWHFEEGDPLQADDIMMEFLTHRSLFGNPGERIYFQLRFFLFPPTRTANAMLMGGPGEACNLRSAVTSERLAITYSVDGAARAPSASDTVVGAAEGAEAQRRLIHRQLAEYLSARYAEVEVWSAEAAMQIGVVRVPLESLVRQGHPVMKAEAEHPILDPMTGEARGFLRVLLSNRGRQPSLDPRALQSAPHVPAPPPPPAGPSFVEQRSVSSPKRNRSRHKARVILEPGVGPAQVAVANESAEEAAKKRSRLEQLRMMRRVELPDNFSNHNSLLSACEEIRQDQKNAEVRRRMERAITTSLTVLAPFGSPEVFYAEFTNPHACPACFSITVMERGVQVFAPAAARQAPLHGVLAAAPEAPLALIVDRDEWRRLVRARKVPPPPNDNYEILAGHGLFSLNAREKLYLPFKYLTFDHPGLCAEAQVASGLSLADVSNLERPNAPDRFFIVQVALHNGPVMRRVEVTARAQPCAVDRTIQFFEAEGSPIEKTMALPARPSTALRVAGPAPPARPGVVSREKNYIFCPDRDVHVQRLDEYEILLRLKAPLAPETRRFFVICYADEFFSEVTGVQLVEVQGLKCEHVRAKVGQSIDRVLAVVPMEVGDAQCVKVFTTDPEIVTVQPTADVDARFGARFAIAVTPMRDGVMACRIHAVDPATKRLLAAFLVVIAADLPDIKVVHAITLPVLTTMTKRLPFKNEATRPMKYTIRSSNPAVVQIRTPEMSLAARDTRYMELLFHACPATLSYTTEVFVFATSEDRAIQETRLLQLTYT